MEHRRELGIVINKYRMLASIHRSQIARMRADASLPPLFEPWISEAGKVSASASDMGFPSLRTKYGWDTYRAMRQLTEGFVRRVEG